MLSISSDLLVAAMIRASARSTFWLPTGRKIPSSNTRSRSPWPLGDRSVISSRNNVPLWASWNRPFRSLIAPVKADDFYRARNRLTRRCPALTTGRGILWRETERRAHLANRTKSVPTALAARLCALSITCALLWEFSWLEFGLTPNRLVVLIHLRSNIWILRNYRRRWAPGACDVDLPAGR